MKVVLLLGVTGCGSTASGPGPTAIATVTATPDPFSHQLHLGWFTEESKGMQVGAYQRAGVDLMVAYHSRTPYTVEWLRSAWAHHVRVLLQPDPSWVQSGNLRALKRFVRRYRTQPALYGWYLFDEPDLNRLPPSRLAAAYHAITSLDSHPVAVSFVTGACAFKRGAIDPAYLDGFDLLMFDRYPFYTQSLHIDVMQDARRVDRTCVRSVRLHHKLGPVLVLQGFGKGQKDGPFTWRDPTYDESACMTQIAVNAGAWGVLYWDVQNADQQVWRNTQRIIGEWRTDPTGASRQTACESTATPAPSPTPR